MLAGVTDTHALVWFANNQHSKIGESARKVFTAADRKDGSGLVVVPTAVLHEISCLLISNKVKLNSDFSYWVTTLDRHGYFHIIDGERSVNRIFTEQEALWFAGWLVAARDGASTDRAAIPTAGSF